MTTRKIENGNDNRREIDRRPWRWRVQKQGGCVARDVMAFLLLGFTILFCYSLSPGWIYYPAYASTALLQSTVSPSHKPFPPPLPPVKFIMDSTLIQNSTKKPEEIKLPSPLPVPPSLKPFPPPSPPIKSMMNSTPIQNSTKRPEVLVKSPPPLPVPSSLEPFPPPPPPVNSMANSTLIQNTTKKSEVLIKSPSPLPVPPSLKPFPPPSPPIKSMMNSTPIQNSTKKPEVLIKSPPPLPVPHSRKPFPPPPPPLESMMNSTLTQNSTKKSDLLIKSPPPVPPPEPNPKEYLLMCTNTGKNQTCPNNYPTNHTSANDPSRPSTCPEYFRWIHEDLRPWKETDVTRAMLEGARWTTHFKLVILGGKVYVEKYKKSLQTRDKFTLWGILQLLRRYPGRLPDLELMFDCGDRPKIQSRMFRRPNSGPPPLFRYCSDHKSLDIVFPDWSFWGWAETNIKPWRNASWDIEQGNKRIKWKERVPYAYWRGNPNVSPWRQDLLKCNVSTQFDWNTRLFVQNWDKEAKMGYKESNVEDQCTYRYKIYIEGWAWSVSERYILGCDSMTLLVRPKYHDFFSRGMLPLVHYWPIRDYTMCKSLKFAVDWGNNHIDKVQSIGRVGSKYIHEDIKMDLVYDYMFHLLNEYAKLLRFKPEIPPNAIELCSETMACQEEGLWRKFMEGSLEKSPSDRAPCNLPLPYNPLELRGFFDRKDNLTRQVEMWEDEY